MTQAKVDGSTLAWDEVQSRLLGLQDGKSLSFEADDESSLIILYISDLGHLVTGCGIGEREYFTLIDRELGEEPATAFDGGNTRIFVRYAFVSETVLLRAARTYFLTGERDRGCEWVIDEDALYE